MDKLWISGLARVLLEVIGVLLGVEVEVKAEVRLVFFRLKLRIKKVRVIGWGFLGSAGDCWHKEKTGSKGVWKVQNTPHKHEKNYSFLQF